MFSTAFHSSREMCDFFWFCSTNVAMPARHQLNNRGYARWTSAPPTLPLLVHASLPIFIGRPPVPPPPPAPRAGHTPASPGIWLCAEVSIMRHDNHSETSLVRGETPGHRVMLKALNKPHYRYVAIAQKSAIFFLKSLFHQADTITKASLY